MSKIYITKFGRIALIITPIYAPKIIIGLNTIAIL